jgi:GT2 family glycosyltransferase
MRVGIGVTTFNRPEMLEKCLKAAIKNLQVNDKPVFDDFYVYNDGSDNKYRGAYARACRPLVGLMDEFRADVIAPPENHGVAYAKNRLIERLLADGCDWIFLCEDDIRPLASEAITEYVRICERRGLHHLSFAHHGPANAGPAVAQEGAVSYYFHSVGAWTIFSRECLLEAGLFDENFVCAWEHVEHELRLIEAGYMPGSAVHRFPDATGSAKWLAEVPGSIEKSSIRPRPDWQFNIRSGLHYWREAKPDTYAMLFGPGTPLEAYARNMLG